MVTAALSLDAALAEAPATARELLERAEASERAKGPAVQLHRSYTAGARAHTYHLHVAIPGMARSLVEPLIDIFAGAARLERQPWYGGFLGGTSTPVEGASSDHQLARVRVSVGLAAPRGYVQLVSRFGRADRGAVVLRSVASSVPEGCVPAFTLAPSGDVVAWAEGTLHWHHLMTVSGVGLLPGRLDGAFMRLLRGTGLDGAERRAYLEEARAFTAWVGDEAAVRAVHARL